MPTNDLALFKALYTKMDWLEARQRVIAENISNANTPGYKPRDIAPLNFKDVLSSSASTLPLRAAGVSLNAGAALGGIGPARTDPAHMSAGGATGGSNAVQEQQQRDTYATLPSGNAVVIEEQLIKANETMVDHRMMTNVYQKNLNMLRVAMGRDER